jgi:formylglycine-generating enzyme required for sulfatase activity
MSPERATSFGRYRLVREIGRGGEATVYFAEDPVLARPVAIKIFPPAVGASDEVGPPAAYRNEVEALSRLRHPGICTIHDAGVHDGCAFFAMSYVEGKPLSAARPESEAEAARLAEEVARIVAAAHGVGVVHGDLKPANILVTPEGGCAVLDFGVARFVDAADGGAPSRLAGTLPYLAPECLSGPGGVAADVYALGAVLFELLAGRPPRTAATRTALLALAGTEDPPLLRSVAPGASKDAEAVVAQALDRDPARRYPTMAALAADLGRLRRGEAVSARRYGPVARVLRWARRHRAAAALCVVGFAFVAIAAVLAAVKNRVLESSLVDTRALAARASEANRTGEEDLVRYERLADRRRVADLEARLERLVPPDPALVPALRRWQDEAAALAGRRDEHARTLEGLRARGRAEAAADRTPEIDDLEARLARLDPRGRPARVLGGLVERLKARLPREPRWAYASDADAWQAGGLEALVRDLDRLAEPVRGGLAEAARRVTDARLVEESLHASRDAWDRARASIADVRECPRYRGLRVEPQLGLVPLRRDPESGLWEFLHLLSGAPPREGARAGSVEPATGIVLVLIPGGVTRVGAVPHLDPDAAPHEGPVHDVRLEPFFLSRYEMTVAQWERAKGGGVAESRDAAAATLPAAVIDWNDATRTLLRLGLELPTEAQWEHAARAGTATPWITGGDATELGRAAHFLAEAAAPVGERAPNAFGLHDVSGNVSEWCRDVFARYEDPQVPGTGERSGLDEREHRMQRGGGYRGTPGDQRLARRVFHKPSTRLPDLGIRPARALRR